MVVDTSATRHVCSDKGLFILLDVIENGENFFIENSPTSEIKGRGKVILKMTSGKELILNNGIYVSKISKNDLHMIFESSKIVLSKSGLFIGNWYVFDGLLKLNVVSIKKNINNASSSTYLLESYNI